MRADKLINTNTFKKCYYSILFYSILFSLPDVNSSPSIPLEQLPRCQSGSCNGLLRPHVVWFGENLDSGVLREAGMSLFVGKAKFV